MKLFPFLALFALVVACTDSPNTVEETEQQEQLTAVVEASEFDDLMYKIDQELSDFSRVESLIYHREDGASVSVVAYLDQNNLITKIEEERVGGANGLNAKIHYYSNGGVMFATKKMSEKVKDNTAYFSEEISFYSADGKPTQSKERVSDYEEYINSEDYRVIEPIAHDNSNALKVLKQEGEYATTFQGFVESGPYHFLIVGENVPENGYTASLSIQEDSPTLRYLKKEGIKALGQELRVQFETLVDGQGYIMQILRDLALVERR